MQITDIPLSSIHAGTNPRTEFDDTALAELAQSIRNEGVLEPVRVVANEDGYRLESGERRFRAAAIAGLEEIPAIVVSGDATEEFVRAIVTNVQRADMNPLDEARAFQALISDHGLTPRGVSDRLGIALARVNARLDLLNLPTAVQQRYFDQQLRLDCRTVLIEIAKVSAELCETVAEHVAGREDYGAVLAKDPMRVIAWVVSEVAKAGGKPRGWFMLPAQHDRALLKLKKAQEEAAKGFDAQWGQWKPEFTAEDLDAAAAVGCAYRPDGSETGLCVDIGWMRDTFDVIYQREIGRRKRIAEQNAKDQAASKAAKIGGVSAGQPVDDAEAALAKEYGKAEREAMRAARVAARAANLELGRKLYGELKVDVGTMDLQAARVLAAAALSHRTADLAVSGLRYCFLDFQTETDGKVTYTSGVVELGSKLIKWVQSDTAAETIRRTVIVLACSRYADPGCVPQSDRRGGLREEGGGGGSQVVDPMGLFKPLENTVRDVVPAASRAKLKPSDKLMAKFRDTWAKEHAPAE